MSRAFVPTHEIFSDTESFFVQLDDGAYYTREEWESATSADWEREENGCLLFQGQIRDGYGVRALATAVSQ